MLVVGEWTKDEESGVSFPGEVSRSVEPGDSGSGQLLHNIFANSQVTSRKK